MAILLLLVDGDIAFSYTQKTFHLDDSNYISLQKQSI